jgi:hypothetical protein
MMMMVREEAAAVCWRQSTEEVQSIFKLIVSAALRPLSSELILMPVCLCLSFGSAMNSQSICLFRDKVNGPMMPAVPYLLAFSSAQSLRVIFVSREPEREKASD